MTDSDPASKERLIMRLKRLEGQIRGLQRMLEEGQKCEDVLTQISACRAALEKIGIYIIANGMKDCLRPADGSEADPEVIEESLALFVKHFGRIS